MVQTRFSAQQVEAEKKEELNRRLKEFYTNIKNRFKLFKTFQEVIDGSSGYSSIDLKDEQSPEEFVKRPRLYPYPVVEYPTTFLRLYRAIVDALEIHKDFIVDLRYLNLKGYVLAPYAPNAIGFMLADSYSKPFQDKHLYVPRMTIGNDFEPDKTAYELVRMVYAAFGFDASAIPFFTKEGSFDFPS